MDKKPKKKEGIARLMELAGTKKGGLTAACTLSVLSSVFRIVPYFTIYSILKKLIGYFSSGESFTFESVSFLVLLTAGSAVLYGVCAYASAMLSHGAAFDILYELRMKLMEKMGKISSGYYTANTQGGITTLQAYDRAGSAFEGLKDSFAKLRDDSKRQEKAGGAVSMYGRAILFLGISIVMGEGGSTLSGGEKQRISIARAILSDAPIVFLDEATASLDPENELLIQRAIDELVKNKTVLVIAHRLQSVMNADDIIVPDSGKIIEQGTHRQLLQKGGRYAALWKEQQTAGSWKLA